MQTEENSGPDGSAAAYVRMSTEPQQYSTSNQMAVIREYAKRRGLQIVKIYSDVGKGGLNGQERDSLVQMIRDVERKQAHVKNILLFDATRWGCFHDESQSACCEYICSNAGVAVHYCAFQDGPETSNPN